MAGPSLPDRVAQCYYRHGLFCSSHPITAVVLAISCFLMCCYPLLNIPLPGSIPTKISLPYNHEEKALANESRSIVNATLPPDIKEPKNSSEGLQDEAIKLKDGIQLLEIMNETARLPHLWAKSSPLLYIQQIIIKTGVWPWREELKLGDAFRAPLMEVFRLLETIRNHQDPLSGVSLGHLCFHVENVKRNVAAHRRSPILPEYSCLLLSPANLWQQNIDRFSADTNIMATVFNQQNLQKGKVSMAEMMFGMHLKDTGIKRYPLRARPRALQYAVTIFFTELDQGYIDSLSEKLSVTYPMQQKWEHTPSTRKIFLIYYPGDFNYKEFIPLCVAFSGLFLYIYFSVRKIEFVKSKVGLAFSAVMSVAASLIMSIGFCFFFGLTLSFQGKEIFPYLVILVGLENVFVLTKSVMSIDSKLDVKIRLAQGLSREGWSITKNLLMEITILTISLFTFVPVIQQFSIFMIVSLLCDFFLQMVFFSTVLGIDIKRKEKSREKENGLQFKGLFNTGPGKSGYESDDFADIYYYPIRAQKMSRSKSHPRLNGLAQQPHANILANPNNSIKNAPQKKLPKRIRLVNIWARTRFFQRAFMLWMVAWVSLILYSSGIIESFLEFNSTSTQDQNNVPLALQTNSGVQIKVPIKDAESVEKDEPSEAAPLDPLMPVMSTESPKPVQVNQMDLSNGLFSSEILNKSVAFISLKHLIYPHPWLRLSEFHWSSVLSQYNVSVSGRYVALLPPLLVKHRVSPEAAALARNPGEKADSPPPSWHALAAALDPLDFTDFELEDGIDLSQPPAAWTNSQSSSELPYYPTSPMEILLLAILCAISVIVITYTMVVLYRCICTRNYAEWRTSWTASDSDRRALNQPSFPLVMEAVPVVVEGHCQEVECLVSDGETVVSSCLQGEVKVWNAASGELLTTIHRNGPQCDARGVQKHFSPNSDILIKEQSAASRRHFFQSSSSDNSDVDWSNVDDRLSYVGHDSISECNRGVEEGEGNPASPQDWWEGLSGGALSPGAVWCMDFSDDLIVIGCSDGKLEFWEASTGNFKCSFDDGYGVSVSHVRFMGSGPRLVAARLSGHLDLLQIERPPPPSNTYRRTHVRTGSAGAIIISSDTPNVGVNQRAAAGIHNSPAHNSKGITDQMRCIRLAVSRAHQQPITALECSIATILTGSQDHTLKVFSYSNILSAMYTLHGHCGPITCAFIDRFSPMVSGSGSQDGLLCVWDLVTGACMYSVQAHDGPVCAISYTASYVLSMGTDERLCIWDRFRGHLLNSVHIGQGAGGCGMLPITHSLVVTGGKGGLTVWDASSGEAVRRVLLGPSDGCVFVRQILPLKDAIVCDYANQLRIVRFPLVTKIHTHNSKSD